MTYPQRMVAKKREKRAKTKAKPKLTRRQAQRIYDAALEHIEELHAGAARPASRQDAEALNTMRDQFRLQGYYLDPTGLANIP